MAKIGMEIVIKHRYWLPSMVAVGIFAMKLGADPDKIADWIVKYGMKLEIR